MNTRFAGNFDSDAQADDAPATTDFSNPPMLDSLTVNTWEGAGEAHPEDSLIQFLRTRRVRASAARCRRNARHSGFTASMQLAADAATGDVPQMLSETSFLRVLQREERRADRSHAPLSLMLFRVAAKERQQVASFVRCLQQRKRETDYLARLDDGVFVVLLPETASEGTRQFDDRLRRAARGVDYSSHSATYPDDRLEAMLDAHRTFSASSVAEAGVEISDERTGGYALKRTIDIVGAFVILLLAAPIMLATAAAILLTSRGPVIFRQSRLGKGGHPFVFYKFRSMRVDAADDIHRRYVEDLIKGRAVSDASTVDDARLAYKMNGDPRITSVGRWIRKTSIDELPQLWNVLKGDMSLVGPRPPIPYEAENYQSWHLRRVLEVKPGITGLWQVEGRSRVSFDDMVRMDIQYAQNCSLSLDLRILARTVGVVLRCEGAG